MGRMWIYVLECSDDSDDEANVYGDNKDTRTRVYVGLTRRLSRRIYEHFEGRGGANTSIYSPHTLLAVYDALKIYKFIRYAELCREPESDDLGEIHSIIKNWDETKHADDYTYADKDSAEVAENFVTEQMMCKRVPNQTVRGGKYTRFGKDNNYYVRSTSIDSVIPLCECGIICDVHENKGRLFFRCGRENLHWVEDYMGDADFHIESGRCDYYELYEGDNAMRELREQQRKDRGRRLLDRREKFPYWNYWGGKYEGQCVLCCKPRREEQMVTNGESSPYAGPSDVCISCFMDDEAYEGMVHDGKLMAEDPSSEYHVSPKCRIDVKSLCAPSIWG